MCFTLENGIHGYIFRMTAFYCQIKGSADEMKCSFVGIGLAHAKEFALSFASFNQE